MYSIDHHYPGSQLSTCRVLLYGNLQNGEFKKFHSVLKKRAELREIDYVLRHFTKVDEKWNILAKFLF